MTQDFTNKTKQLIDNLKGICASYGLGNDGNEFKIITQSFLYKFLNDRFGYEIKLLDSKLAMSENWEKDIANYSDNDFNMLLARMSPGSARLRPEHFISNLFNRQTEENFAKLFDDTLRDVAIMNNAIFSVHTIAGTNIRLFDDSLSGYIADNSERDNFCRAIINQLVESSFEGIFSEKFDFFATIFEYMIKDYNKDGGGKYAEYYTPHAVAKVMAQVLVDDGVSNVTCYDPAAGSGTLLMNLAHAIGEDKCSIFSQDISQKSSGLLRLNLILNGLTHSINNIVQGNTVLKPAHVKDKFDYIVSNPPFKLDFSDYQPELLANNAERFFAGVPNIPSKDKDKMAIYLLFIQHIMFSLAPNGKAAVVVPTGFITAQQGIEKKIREKLVASKMLQGVVNMPSNIFATTGTNVSILFIDKANSKGEVVLVDASTLGTKVKDGKNQRTILSEVEEKMIIDTFRNKKVIDNYSVVVSYEDIVAKNYSLNAGHYFEVKMDHIMVTGVEFDNKLNSYVQNLNDLFQESNRLDNQILENLSKIKYDF